MGKYLLVATSNANPGEEDAYNAWYDSTHMGEMLAIPGVVSGKRYDALPVSPHPLPGSFLAIYELELDDPATLVPEIYRRIQAGEMAMTDTIDGPSAQLWLLKAR